MDSKSGQLINLLGFDLVDSALASLTELWEQHISTIQNIVIKDFKPEVKSVVKCEEPEFFHVERVQKISTPSEKKISPPPPPPPITVSNTDQNDIPDALQDSEWSTEDESFESIESIGDETYQRMTGKRSSNSSHKLSTVKKQKRKQTEYFTPSIPRKSKRITRATASKVDSTPKSLSRNNLMVKASSSVIKSSNQMMLSVEKPIGTTISGSSIASSVGASNSVSQTDSVKGKRTISRATATRITRATANKVEETPKIVSPTKSNLMALASSSVSKSSNKLLSAEKSNGATTSGSSIASSVTTVSSICRTDSIKGKRAVARTCTTPDTKSLTASAAKKRLEEEEKRKAALAQMKEKEEKAMQTKQENLKMKVQLTKLKNEEKRKKIGQIKKKEEEELQEKRQKEQSKLEEIEKRRREKEEARRREMLRNQEAAKRKQIEFDLRKQQEELERKARLLKQEEQNRQKKEENERIRKEQEKILRMIAQHNSNLQKGQNTSATQQKVDPPAATISQFKQPLPPTSEAQPVLLMNKTFDKEVEVKKETPPPPVSVKVESYPISPPPKPKPAPVNYDISDIKSDDDTDDEERPKKLIPSWAKGDALIAALDKQFAKSRRARERQIREIFPNYDFSIQLADIFKSSNRIVHPKYDKRTSSAVWSSPPCNSTLNCSSMLSDGY